jgi:hypothetical protein
MLNTEYWREDGSSQEMMRDENESNGASMILLGFRWFHSATFRIARSPVSLKMRLYGLN